MPASNPFRPPASFGDKPGSMILRGALDRMPWYLTGRGNRSPIRWSRAERTTVGCREKHGHPDARLFTQATVPAFTDLIIDGHR